MHEADNRITTAARTLLDASDGHCWRAQSFVATLNHLCASPSIIRPEHLGAVVEALGEHVEAMAEAIDKARDALIRAPEASA